MTVSQKDLQRINQAVAFIERYHQLDIDNGAIHLEILVKVY